MCLDPSREPAQETNEQQFAEVSPVSVKAALVLSLLRAHRGERAVTTAVSIFSRYFTCRHLARG